MRRIDFYAGFFLCRIMAFLQRIRGKSRKTPSVLLSLNNKKVLIIKFLGFGSIIMTAPLMRELKRIFPEVKIHFLTFSDNVQICESIPLIDKTYYLEKKSFYVFLKSLAENLLSIRKQNYDVVFNLEFFSNFSLLVTSLSRAKLAVCFGGRHEYRKMLCQRIVSYENESHVIDKFFNFLKLFIPASSIYERELMELEESPEARKRALDLLTGKNINIERDFLVIININAGEMSRIRKWPLEYYQEIVTFLLKKKSVKIILIGGKEDTPYVAQLEKMIPSTQERILNLSGRITLKELISLIKISRLFIGNDSGPLHIAEACRLPNVSFFGPESPRVYGHPGSNNYTFYSNLPCSPCLNVYTNKDTRCDDNICLKMIKPEKVIEVLENKYFKGS